MMNFVQADIFIQNIEIRSLYGSNNKICICNILFLLFATCRANKETV